MKILALILFPMLLLSSCASQAPMQGQSGYSAPTQMQTQNRIMEVHRENLRGTSRFF